MVHPALCRSEASASLAALATLQNNASAENVNISFALPTDDHRGSNKTMIIKVIRGKGN